MFWCDQRLQLTIDGPAGSRSLVIPRPFARIGSEESAELVFPPEETGGRSWYVHATPDGVYSLELGHRDKEPRRRGRWVAPTEAMQLGDHALYVKAVSGNAARGKPAAGTAEPVSDEVAADGKPVIEFVSDSHPPRRRQLGRLTIVGRERPSHLRIDDAELAATHCVLYWSAGCLWVIDLLSERGTWRDGVRCEVTSLARGESIRIGQTRLTLLGSLPRDGDRDHGETTETADDSDDQRHPPQSVSRKRKTDELQIKREQHWLRKMRSRDERLQAKQQQRAATWNATRAEQARELADRGRELDAREAELRKREQTQQRGAARDPDVARQGGESGAPQVTSSDGRELRVNELQAWRLGRMVPRSVSAPAGDAAASSHPPPGTGRSTLTTRSPPAAKRVPRRWALGRASGALACMMVATGPLLAQHAEALWQRPEFRLFPLSLALAGVLLWLRRPARGSPAVALRSRLETPLGLCSLLVLAVAVGMPSPHLAAAASLGTTGVLLLHLAGRAALTNLTLPWGLMWIVVPLPLGWDMFLQTRFEAIVNVWSGQLLRVWGQVSSAHRGQALLETACSGWTAPVVTIAAGVFLVLRKHRPWPSVLVLMALVPTFALLVSSLVVLVARLGYADPWRHAPLVLIGCLVAWFSIDAVGAAAMRRRRRRRVTRRAPPQAGPAGHIQNGRARASSGRVAWHWWLTAPGLVMLALFQSLLWWSPDRLLARDPLRRVSVFPRDVWAEGPLPAVERDGQTIEVVKAGPLPGGPRSEWGYRWQLQSPQREMALVIDLPVAGWQPPPPSKRAVGWFDVPPRRWFSVDTSASGGPVLASACRRPTGGDYFYLFFTVVDERGGALHPFTGELGTWQSQLAQAVNLSLFARVVGWPAAGCRLRLEFASSRELTAADRRRIAQDFRQYVTWLQQTLRR
ncbi:MAG: hypothetical protein CMJ59_16765 [Planctomycetaceae bacterium]|nr:hypothetical protein [Planctomycetaceae bacterium]